MTRLTKNALLLLALALLLTGFGYWRWHTAQAVVAQEALTAQSRAQARGGVNAMVSNMAPSTANPAPANSLPPRPAKRYTVDSLPPPNQPLREIVEILKKESDSGNYLASCRLAEEISRCQLLAYDPENLQRKFDEAMEKVTAALTTTPADSAESAWLATKKRYMTESREVEARVCGGFENREGLEPWRYKLRAALAGHAPSMSSFATSIRWLNPLEFNVETLAAYREYAPQFLLQAAHAGVKPALLQLARAYAGEPTIVTDQPSDGSYEGFNLGGVKLAETDIFKAVVYFHAAMPVVDAQTKRYMEKRELPPLKKQLSAEQWVAAEAQAEALIASWPPEVLAKVNQPKKPLTVKFSNCE